MALHPRLHRANQELSRGGPQAGLQVGGEHFAVARRAEQPADPLELPGQPLAVWTRDDLAERPEGGTHPAGGYPHLVHRVEFIGAYHRLERLQRVDLQAQIGQHDVAGRG